MKRVYLTDKQAGSALLSSVMGAEITIARLRKKLKDREERIAFVAGFSGPMRRNNIGCETCAPHVGPALNLKIRNWRPK